MNNSVLPFLKWAGGKRWLVPHLEKIIEKKKFSRYFEPFLGGGAVFFSISPDSAILSDVNEDLINCYVAIKSDWREVRDRLREHHDMHSKDYYYYIRDLNSSDDCFDNAARFIYLNRTCWNGLYRVNMSGKFNVPIGTKSNVIMETDNFDLIAEKLKNAQLISIDFERVVDMAGDGDLLFADPPYTVKHNNNGFVKYNEKIFSWSDQVRLSAALNRAKNRGAIVVATNAAHNCIEDIYKDFTLIPVLRKSVISGKSNARGAFEELLIFGG